MKRVCMYVFTPTYICSCGHNGDLIAAGHMDEILYHYTCNCILQVG